MTKGRLNRSVSMTLNNEISELMQQEGLTSGKPSTAKFNGNEKEQIKRTHSNYVDLCSLAYDAFKHSNIQTIGNLLKHH